MKDLVLEFIFLKKIEISWRFKEMVIISSLVCEVDEVCVGGISGKRVVSVSMACVDWC